MRLEDYDYELPPEAIAQEACEPRDAARLLVYERDGERVDHRRVRDLDQLLEPGDLLVVNDTKVLPARLRVTRATGGAVELFLLARAAGSGFAWSAMARPGRRLKDGELLVGDGFCARLFGRDPDDDSLFAIELRTAEDGELDDAGGHALLERAGELPLPPYIERAPDDPRRAGDRERYQTIYARHAGAVAAPTAGLHFTDALFERLAARGVERTSVTLHVGAGTFRPIEAQDPREHRMHAERFSVEPEAVAAFEACKARGGRVIAVGTTSARVLETLAHDGGVRAGAGESRLFLYPGKRFLAVDGLLTNFHLPRSSLLLLVSALCGRERMLALYREALESGYRFYSFGDAMLIL